MSIQIKPGDTQYLKTADGIEVVEVIRIKKNGKITVQALGRYKDVDISELSRTKGGKNNGFNS